jgi:DNA-directed RNA polymerase subunit RPC12/RpoP
MSLACPSCGSRFLRDSQPRDFNEKVNKLRFISPLRCLDCQTRFVTRTLVVRDLFFARCPECHRMDLNSWTGKTFDPPWFTATKIWFGAKRWRCEYCRVNFASFRKRKEVFTFKRWLNREAEMKARRAAQEGRQAREATSSGAAASGAAASETAASE